MGFPARHSTLQVTPTVSGDVTVTLTGVIAVTFLGALTAAASVGLTGSSATTSISSFLSTGKALTSVVGTTSLGTVKATPTFPLTGKVATTSLGTVVVLGANQQSIADSFRVQLLNGQHAFGTSVIRAGTGADTFKAALYFTTATRNASDTIYSSAGEVTGTNYVAGGVVLVNTVPPTNTGSVAFWTPSSSAVFSNITVSTPFDCMILYNNTATAKLSVAVFVFGAQVVTAGDFTLQFAANNAATGLIRLT